MVIMLKLAILKIAWKVVKLVKVTMFNWSRSKGIRKNILFRPEVQKPGEIRIKLKHISIILQSKGIPLDNIVVWSFVLLAYAV